MSPVFCIYSFRCAVSLAALASTARNSDARFARILVCSTRNNYEKVKNENERLKDECKNLKEKYSNTARAMKETIDKLQNKISKMENENSVLRWSLDIVKRVKTK